MRLAALAFLIASPALAYDDPTAIAYALGSVLGSEAACGLKLDAVAVEAFVADRIDPAEMGFATHMAGIASATAVQVDAMTDAARAAHCQAVKASARFYGLTR